MEMTTDLHLKNLTLVAVCRMDQKAIEHTVGAQGEHCQDIGLQGSEVDEKWIDMWEF